MSMKLTMELYETDIYELQKFIAEEKAAEFTDRYLILYNFAMDCKYAEYIQPELIRYLLPFYLKVMEEAVFCHNKKAVDIYFEFNLLIFFNKERFINAVGELNYRNIMTYYIEQTIKKMEMQSVYPIEWISLYNTTIALYEGGIEEIFCRIFKGSSQIKYSFLHYLSVLLFKESDFWSNNAVNYFNKEIDMERIKKLFIEVKPLLCNDLELELVDLLYEEMNQSYTSSFFEKRKVEYLKKINCESEKQLYWDTTF